MLAKLDIGKNVLIISNSFTEYSFSRESVGHPSLPLLKSRQTGTMSVCLVHPGRRIR